MISSELRVGSSEFELSTPNSQLPTILLVFLCALVSGCASWPRQWGSQPCCIHNKPVVHKQPIWWHLFDETVLDPLSQPFRVVRPLRKLVGLPVRSLNLQDGQVRDAAFFTNRDVAALSAEAVRWGPTQPEDLPQPPFTVTKAKTEGKTAGFFVTDSRGERFLFKLDPAEAPELLSAAEVITSKLIYALGYHVPSYEVIDMALEDLRAAEEATVKIGGKVQLFSAENLQGLLKPQLRDNRLRVASSKIIDGQVLGPARFKRFKDCAEMRALRLAYAWVNNVDTKDHNTLLAWEGTKTVGYLFDFGTALGADAGLGGPKTRCEGWTYAFDLKEISLEVLTLGLHRPVCDVSPASADVNVGFFSPTLDPPRWKPYAPNRAFKEMNDADARWMAARLKSFSRAQLEAAVSAGKYSDPQDAQFLVDALDQRRQTIIRHYLGDET